MDFPSGRNDFYLTEIGEPEDNSLRIVLLEATGRGPVEVVPVGEARRIQPDPHKDRALEIVWDVYVAYAVRSESYARVEDGEFPNKSNFRCHTASTFLRYVTDTTWATDEIPGPLVHWELITLNHILDVVGVAPPRICAIEVSKVARQPTIINFARYIAD